MCRWRNKLLLSIQMILLFALCCHFILAESANNEFISPTGDACPGDVLMYFCTINIVGARNTIWSGTAFNCSSIMNETILRHSQFASPGASGRCNGGAITTRSLGVVDNNCYSSQLNVTVSSDMNNKTIQCAYSLDRIVTVGSATLSIATASPTQVRLVDVSSDELIFNWRPSTDHLNYIVNSTCGICPNMTNTTVVTCSDLSLSTTLTMCTFSVRRVACGTIGTPSLPIVVTLGVPAAPDVRIIPQYSIMDDRQSLTGFIVLVEQNVTLFLIADTISGSTTSYSISYSGITVQNLPVCDGSTCDYSIDTPSSICSTSLNVIDITIIAANRLGQGQPSEPFTIECNNRFMRVRYDLEAMTITCRFENELDVSPKSCSVKYGTCNEELYFAQGNTTDGSIITLRLNSNAINSNCYIVTASNDTLMVMVKGKFVTHQPNSGARRSVKIVVPIVIIVFILLIVTIITIFLIVYHQGRCRHYANQHKPRIEADNVNMDKMGLDADDYDIVASHISSLLIGINSEPFKVSKIKQKCTLNELKSKFGKYIFLEYTQKKEEGKEDILDAILRDKDKNLFSLPDVQKLISQKQPYRSRVFVLPLNQSGGEIIRQNISILHQNPDKLKQIFRVFYVGGRTDVSDFFSQHNLDFESQVVLYPFPKTGLDLGCYRDVVRVSNSKQDQLVKECKKLSESTLECDTGIHMFYDLKHCVPDGKDIKPLEAIEEYFIQITTDELNSHLKLNAGSLILVYKGEVGPREHKERCSVM